jgi:AcrR family transcriptional regulator
MSVVAVMVVLLVPADAGDVCGRPYDVRYVRNHRHTLYVLQPHMPTTSEPTEPKPPGTPNGTPRTPLSRDRALRAAVELADAEGIDAVTMRRLARTLGVEAMSLYHHVANKSDILDGMVDLVFAEIALPDDRDGWVPAMTARATSVRDALTRHRWAVGLMESRSSPGPATLRHHDAVIGCCRRSGFSVEMTAHAFSLMDSYIYGFVLQEIGLPFEDGDDLSNMVDTMLPPSMVDTYPYFAELAAEFVLRPGYSYSDEFAFGLRLVLETLDNLRTSTPPASTPPRFAGDSG